MARPAITLTGDQCREVETLAALLNQEQIADYFGIARNTFRAICDRDPEVLERYKRGKAKAIAHVANGLLQKARSGCTTSSIFYLKTQAGWRETAAIEHSGTTAVEHTGAASEKLAMFLDRIAERQAAPGASEPPRIAQGGLPGEATQGAPGGGGEKSGGLIGKACRSAP